MTSQVALFNMEAVAIASDSVRTVSNGAQLRTLETSEKLFDLGDGHRVVMLTSGSAAIMRVPVSVLFGEFRSSLAGPLPTVGDYARGFVDWLVARTDLFDEKAQDTHFGWQLRDYYGMVRVEVRNAIAADGLIDDPWDSTSVQGVVNRVVDTLVNAIKEDDDLPDLNARQDENYLDARRELIEFSFIDQVEGMPRTVAADWRLTKELPGLILAKAEQWTRDTVVAFIGYGADDLFPKHQVVTVHGVINNQVRAEWWEPAGVTPSNRAIITPFGQDEAIETFLRAYNEDFLAVAHQRVDHLIEEVDLSGVLLPDEGDSAEVARLTHVALDDDFRRLSQERFIEPVLDAIEHLPRTDLARMAEALVGVQALRAALARQQPTVGGPIDVAVISRSHGVQWLRRKEVTLE